MKISLPTVYAFQGDGRLSSELSRDREGDRRVWMKDEEGMGGGLGGLPRARLRRLACRLSGDLYKGRDTSWERAQQKRREPSRAGGGASQGRTP